MSYSKISCPNLPGFHENQIFGPGRVIGRGLSTKKKELIQYRVITLVTGPLRCYERDYIKKSTKELESKQVYCCLFHN